jgi:hypothetical protein
MTDIPNGYDAICKGCGQPYTHENAAGFTDHWRDYCCAYCEQTKVQLTKLDEVMALVEIYAERHWLAGANKPHGSIKAAHREVRAAIEKLIADGMQEVPRG